MWHWGREPHFLSVPAWLMTQSAVQREIGSYFISNTGAGALYHENRLFGPVSLENFVHIGANACILKTYNLSSIFKDCGGLQFQEDKSNIYEDKLERIETKII